MDRKRADQEVIFVGVWALLRVRQGDIPDGARTAPGKWEWIKRTRQACALGQHTCPCFGVASNIPCFLHLAFPVQISGSITALATPFTASGGLDLGAWRAQLHAQIEAGTQGLVVAGSTGEAAMLTPAEFSELVASAVNVVGARVPVLAGAGLSGTAHTIEHCRRAQAAGATAVLVATPAYVRPTQAGMVRHFEAVADALEVPVVLYNVPSRTAVDLLPDTVATLAAHPGIVGIKEAVSDAARTAALLPLRSSGFVVLSGDDGSACEAMLAGADGVISVASNVVPVAFRRLCDLARSGAAAARSLAAELAPLHRALMLEPNPIPLKALLGALGLYQNCLRLPLLPLSSRFEPELAALAQPVLAVEARLRLEHAA